MKEVILTKGYVSMVDDEDYDMVSCVKWQAYVSEHTVYAQVGSLKICGFSRMHRMILNVTDPKVEVDHKNNNGLDNRRCNLRLATRRQNAQNSKKRKTSLAKGVSWDPVANKWRAVIYNCGKQIYLGWYHDPDEASNAYDVAAIKYFGEFAKTNR